MVPFGQTRVIPESDLVHAELPSAVYGADLVAARGFS